MTSSPDRWGLGMVKFGNHTLAEKKAIKFDINYYVLKALKGLKLAMWKTSGS